VGESANAAAVDFATSDGTATAGQDYTHTSGTLTFGPGVLSQALPVSIINDAVAEPGETMTLSLSNPQPPSGVRLGDIHSAIVTITDNDQGLQFTAPTYMVPETAAKGTVTVKRVGGTSGSVAVDYSATGGSAINGIDYTLDSGTLTFGPGQVSKFFTLYPRNDTDVEGSETIELTLGNPVGATVIGSNPAVLVITDNEPVFRFSAPEYAAGESLPVKRVAVARTGPPTSQATVDYHITGGTATAGADYTASTSGTLVFAAGKLSQTLSIAPNEDNADEPKETVTLTLSNPSAGYGIGSPGTAVVTIIDNDVAGTVQFKSKIFTVSEDGGNATIIVTRVGGTSDEAKVRFATSDGTAEAGTDYVSTSEILTFGLKETSKSVSIAVLDNGARSGNSFLHLTLSGPEGGLVLGSPATAVLWIVEPP
jgi:hypothetical protein